MEKYILTINRNSKMFKFQKSIIKTGKIKKDYFNKKEFFRYSDLKKKIKNSSNSEVLWFNQQFKDPEFLNVTITNFLIKYNNLENAGYFKIIDENDLSKTVFNNYSNSNIKFKTNGLEKQDNLISIMYEKYWKILKDMNYVNREIFEKELILDKLIFTYQNINLNGNLLMSFFNWSQNQTTDMLYLILLLFNKVNIYFGEFIYCSEFNPIIKKEYLQKLKHNSFVISEKPELNRLSKYLINNFKEKNNQFDLLLKIQINKLLIEKFNLHTLLYKRLNLDIDVIHKIYFETFKRTINKNELIKVHSAINKKEGNFITKLIKKYNLRKCLEIGFANGISAMYILSSSKNITLTSIDPFQKTQWNSNGLKLLTNSKLINRHKLIEQKSYQALPELLKANKNNFDLIFIDGWHTFDYTLIDFFYADKLLKKGGIIVVDDAKHQGVAKCLKYINTNYNNFYQKIESHNTIGVYKKIKEDDRDWNFHKFF